MLVALTNASICSFWVDTAGRMQPELAELLRWLAMGQPSMLHFWRSLAGWHPGVQHPFCGGQTMQQTHAFARAWVTLCGTVLSDARAALCSPEHVSSTLWQLHQVRPTSLFMKQTWAFADFVLQTYAWQHSLLHTLRAYWQESVHLRLASNQLSALLSGTTVTRLHTERCLTCRLSMTTRTPCGAAMCWLQQLCALGSGAA